MAGFGKKDATPEHSFHGQVLELGSFGVWLSARAERFDPLLLRRCSATHQDKLERAHTRISSGCLASLNFTVQGFCILACVYHPRHSFGAVCGPNRC